MTDEDFGALYRALQPEIFVFAARRVGAEAAKDVVSETFEVAWRKRHEFPEDRRMWAAWLVGIAKNKVLQEAQRRKRKHHDNRFVEDWTIDAPQAGEDVAELVIDSELGRRIYAQLTPAEQLLFDVAFFRELTPSDCALVLGITTTAFTTRVSRLRQRIRTLRDQEHTAVEPSTKEVNR